MSEIFKALPTNITKDNLLQAIAKIDSEGIPKNADSNYYDVLFEGKKYPPKVIVSFANLFANGEIIDRKTFPGGRDTSCFKLLESNGFEIIKKELKLPFQIALYDIHGASAIENYQTLKSPDNSIFLWDDSRFNKLNEGDYVFWVNRSLKEALFTKIASKNVTPIFSEGKNSITFKGFTGKAAAESPDRYKNFVGFEIIERCEIEDFWDYNDTSTFASQLMAINLLVVGTKLQELPKKIEKLEDLDRIFSESAKTCEIIQTAIEILEEKAGDLLNRVLTEDEFLEYIKQFDQEELSQYFYWLKYFLTQLNISIGDERVTYNYYNRSLIFTVGQRYGLIYKPFDKEAKYFVMSDSPIGNLNIDKTFGGEPLCYFCRRNDLNLSEAEANEVLKAMKIELSRTGRSRHRKYNKDNFERYILEGYKGVVKSTSFISSFIDDASKQNLIFPPYLVKRYVASLATKPFVIFTGLSGSGKTKLAQTFAKWICQSKDQYQIISVGADWTNREPLLGYPNSLDTKSYVLPDNGALKLILDASKNLEENVVKPYFLILDEMNLSHVERYFADFLSAMESKEEIMLYSGESRKASNGLEIPTKIKLPANLYIVGTVNIDETTYMFSPKVLDRANTIEFRLDHADLKTFFETEIATDPTPLDGNGSGYANSFLGMASKTVDGGNKDSAALLLFFEELQKLGAEFGYRTANEMLLLMKQLNDLGLDGKAKENALDVAVMQKMLPKLHGSRSKLSKVLPVLASFCLNEKNTEKAKQLLDTYKNERKLNTEQMAEVLLPLSFTKIARMYTNAIENGFANYAEG